MCWVIFVQYKKCVSKEINTLTGTHTSEHMSDTLCVKKPCIKFVQHFRRFSTKKWKNEKLEIHSKNPNTRKSVKY
ncbi:hypothetical protein JT322_gp29 [Proteus phage ASh-2020a]|uniref:hypothetical protein n=1 Tax=Proteus phage ASh-2020a TaxID=2753656 RepID=UPI001EE6863E|nr:hypothetical protein JT322_gp29 [Proteus phage ASh-2020a]